MGLSMSIIHDLSQKSREAHETVRVFVAEFQRLEQQNQEQAAEIDRLTNDRNACVTGENTFKHMYERERDRANQHYMELCDALKEIELLKTSLEQATREFSRAWRDNARGMEKGLWK